MNQIKLKSHHIYNEHTDYLLIIIQLLRFLNGTKLPREYSWKVLYLQDISNRPKSTKRAIRYARTHERTDPNYRKYKQFDFFQTAL